MRFNKLDLNLIVALDHLIASKSVSHTAARMNLSQSAMSNALNRLRQFFDDPLLVPLGRGLELTSKARALQDPLRDILVRLEAILSSEDMFDPVTSDHEFKIIMSDYTMIVIMPHVLALAEQRGASVRFRFMPQVEEPRVAIERGDADLLVTPSVLLSDNHPSEQLFEDTFICVAWRDGVHGRRVLTKDAFLAARHIRMVPPRTSYSFENQSLVELGVERIVETHCYSFYALPHLVIGSDRLATIQRRLAERVARSLPLALHPLPFPFAPLRQCMQWHEYRATDPALVWLRHLMREAAARIDAPVPETDPTRATP